MPKVGVGITQLVFSVPSGLVFQSIYAQSGRWNSFRVRVFVVGLEVSIHLCPKWALECAGRTQIHRLGKRFNPSMPKVGVGIGKADEKLAIVCGFQSIYAQSGRWN